MNRNTIRRLAAAGFATLAFGGLAAESASADTGQLLPGRLPTEGLGIQEGPGRYELALPVRCQAGFRCSANISTSSGTAIKGVDFERDSLREDRWGITRGQDHMNRTDVHWLYIQPIDDTRVEGDEVLFIDMKVRVLRCPHSGHEAGCSEVGRQWFQGTFTIHDNDSRAAVKFIRKGRRYITRRGQDVKPVGKVRIKALRRQIAPLAVTQLRDDADAQAPAESAPAPAPAAHSQPQPSPSTGSSSPSTGSSSDPYYSSTP